MPRHARYSACRPRSFSERSEVQRFGFAIRIIFFLNNAKVATATLAQEQFRAAVVSWRRLLAGTCATKCHWRINGAVGHIQKLADALAFEGRQLTMEEATIVVDDLAVEFTFRQDKLDLDTAVALNAQGFVTSEAVTKILMRDYGLCQSDVMVPLSPAEQAVLEYKQLVLQQKEEEVLAEGEAEKTAPKRGGGDGAGKAAPKRHGFVRRRSAEAAAAPSLKKKKQFGDIGMTDVGSIGFAEKTRKPSRNGAPKV